MAFTTTTTTAMLRPSRVTSLATSSTMRLQNTAKSLSSSSENDHNNSKKNKNKEAKLLQQQMERRRSVFAILAGAFLNLLGFTMAGPITPALGKHFGLQIGASFGSLTSAYPLGMLLGLFVWPALSDKWGRKPIMTMSLLGSGLGLAAQSYVVRHSHITLGWFLAARAFTGAFAGSSPVSKAFLADVGSKDGKFPRYLALRDAASTMAFIAGPMLGGLLYDLRRRFTGTEVILTTAESLSFVIAISAAASLAAGLLVAGLVSDVRKHKTVKKKSSDGEMADEDDDEDENDVYQEEELISCPLGTRMWTGVASVCVVSFLFNIGDSTFHAFFSALLRDGAGLGAGDIGLLYTMLACISFTVSTTGASWIMKTYGPVLTCAAGLTFVGAGLSGLGLAASSALGFVKPQFGVLAAAAATYYCGVPLYGPTIPTMLLRCVPSHRRGAIMGLDGTINTIARIISPLIMGDIYRRFGAGAAFGVAGLAVFGGVATSLFRRFVVLRDLDSTTPRSVS